jgi:hypothetical protein
MRLMVAVPGMGTPSSDMTRDLRKSEFTLEEMM